MGALKWILIIGLGIVFGITLLFAGCGLLIGAGLEEVAKEMEAESAPLVVKSDDIIKESTTDQTAGKETTTEDEIIELRVGGSAQTTDIKVTILSAVVETSYFYENIFGEEDGAFPDDGNKFVLVEAQFENVGTSAEYITGGSFSMQDSEGFRYDDSYYKGDDGLDLFQEIYPKQKTKGKILFEVPKDATGLQIVFNFGNLFTGTKLVYWKI